MKFFSAESPFYKFISRLWDIITLNFFWLICSLPIITIGPATTAAYSILLKMVEGTEGYVVKPFFKAFKENFKQALPIGIIEVVCIYAISLDAYYLIYGDLYGFDNPFPFLIAGVLASVIVIGLFMYVYPLLARYENKTFLTLRNSGRISMTYFGRTLLLTIIIVVEVMVFLINGFTMIFALFVGPCIIMLTISAFAMRIFKRIERDGGVTQKPKTEEDLFNEEIEREVEEELKRQNLK